MKLKKALTIGVLLFVGMAAYVFLFHLQIMTEPTEVVEGFSESIRYNGEPAGSPDIQLLKGILKALANLLPAS